MDLNISRKEIIKRYEDIVKKWNEDCDLIELYPEKYKEILLKLEALKNGYEYKVKDITLDCWQDMFVKMWSAQRYYDSADRMVGDVKKCNYDFKTDIPEFVDKLINL